MKYFGILTVILLAMAITNAPFGMGRMMAQANVPQGMHSSHEMQHDAPAGQKSPAPRYVLCAACVAVAVQVALVLDSEVVRTPLNITELAIPDGLPGLPPVPPPISIS